MTRRLQSSMQCILCVLIGLGFSTAVANAQSVKPDTPPDAEADSNAAMKLTTNDPRIGNALSGHHGTWKWVVPPVKMAGGFDDHDPIGVISGKLIPADCSLNWTDPDSHKLYCFTSATSLIYFMDVPHTYLTAAEKKWQSLTGKPAI
ncbi:hypothetical protein CWB41_12090 [Methylovirgula ligni]|uniref:YHS domain-containing protein n=1 Tax=Methylovirgula ligni TaxID=569860 RepID=A0A3D9Z416_9HYPH|nr:hypothetical protein [Methylovirgula ligni]QAY96378.1 hypothetical protein CWB41_12090 [Methylovirgula ligni]REF85899.1 hypothetical protein DES32_1938 [Methylovirgula ligni]